MKKSMVMGCGVIAAILLLICAVFVLYGVFSYNKIIKLDETVKEKWSQVENVYQRRLDLIPNLVETVKGYTSHEKETLLAVTEARAKVGGMVKIGDKALNNPKLFQQFQQTQDAMSSALQRLMVVVEKYPDLKASQNYLSLQDQLEGTENRIAVARKRFNEASRNFNTYIKQFPKMYIANKYGFTEKPYFEADKGAEKAPKVKF